MSNDKKMEWQGGLTTPQPYCCKAWAAKNGNKRDSFLLMAWVKRQANANESLKGDAENPYQSRQFNHVRRSAIHICFPKNYKRFPCF